MRGGVYIRLDAIEAEAEALRLAAFACGVSHHRYLSSNQSSDIPQDGGRLL